LQKAREVLLHAAASHGFGATWKAATPVSIIVEVGELYYHVTNAGTTFDLERPRARSILADVVEH
jgi:hypothetical protein